ncbi:RadC family protein [Pseudomonadota bacterium]
MNQRFTTCEKPGYYRATELVSASDILCMANRLTQRRFSKGRVLSNSSDASAYLTFKLNRYEREVFCVLFLDNRHRVLAFEEMFFGTINGTTVHPREVAKRALHHNAAAAIIAHNHPSGEPEPSQADIAITRRLAKALELVEIRLLDHIVVGIGNHVSLADRGLI